MDTIAAIATAHGIGSIAIVRLSGGRALTIAKALTQQTNFSPRYAHLYPLYTIDQRLIDEAIVIYFQSPRSFTGEDVVEFQCHGGVVVAQSVLDTVLRNGARLATPGEFSKRAFLNGQIDLTEAEAIARLIESQSDDAATILAKQMKGELREYVESARDRLLHLLAYSEVSIDYAEEDLPEDLVDDIQSQLNDLKSELKQTLTASEARKGLMQGFRVSLIGKPNVGKSSLLNKLLNYNRAIVSEVAGTTRDTIEEQVRIGTHLIRMVDTAGIREASDQVERIGIERTLDSVEQSDIVIALFDGNSLFDDEDHAILELLHLQREQRMVIVVVNKSDLPQRLRVESIKHFDPIHLSARHDVNTLVKRLESIMDAKNDSQNVMLISSRQIHAVEDAVKAIEESVDPLREGALEIFSFHVNDAIHALSSMTRPFEHDEMLDKMFGSFCLGK